MSGGGGRHIRGEEESTELQMRFKIRHQIGGSRGPPPPSNSHSGLGRAIFKGSKYRAFFSRKKNITSQELNIEEKGTIQGKGTTQTTLPIKPLKKGQLGSKARKDELLSPERKSQEGSASRTWERGPPKGETS